MPKELNFFDTNPDVYSYLFTLSVSSLKDYPSGIRSLYASLCIEVLKHQSRTEPVVVVRIAARNVRIQHTCIRAIIATPTTHNKRFRRYSLIPNKL